MDGWRDESNNRGSPLWFYMFYLLWHSQPSLFTGVILILSLSSQGIKDVLFHKTRAEKNVGRERDREWRSISLRHTIAEGRKMFKP
jgi:hypothetical protein